MSDIYPPDLTPVRKDSALEEAMYRRSNAVRRVGLLLLAAALLAVVVLQTGTLVSVRNTQIEGTPTGKRIIDCTEPGGECYERGQRQTAQILSDAQRIILLSAACAVDLDPGAPVDRRVREITDCVTKRLAAPAKP